MPATHAHTDSCLPDTRQLYFDGVTDTPELSADTKETWNEKTGDETMDQQQQPRNEERAHE